MYGNGVIDCCVCPHTVTPHYPEITLGAYIALLGAGQLDLSCKFLCYLGTFCPVGLNISNRILKVNPAVLVVSKILRLSTDFGHFWTACKYVWTVYGHFFDR